MRMQKLKIAVCSTVHQHDDARIFHRQAASLAKAFEVTLFICAPFREQTIHENLKIIGLPIWKSKISRIKNWLILLTRLYRGTADVYIFHDPELMTMIPLIKILKRGKIIYDIHENYHGSLKETAWLPTPFRHLLAWGYIGFEKFAFLFTDMIWYAVPDIGLHYQQYRRPAQLLVRNVPLLTLADPLPPDQVKNQFVFVGSMGPDRGITQLVKAFALFRKRISGYRLILAGPFYSADYQLEIENLIGELDLKADVDMLGRVPFKEVPGLVRASKAGMSLHQPTYNFLRSLPLKLFEYLGLGVPVIASDFKNFREVVDAADCGKCVDPQNIQAIAAAMEEIVADEAQRREMGIRGKALVEQAYNWEKEGEKIINAVSELTK